MMHIMCLGLDIQEDHGTLSHKSFCSSLQVLQHAKPLNQLPLVGPLFTPPVNVTAIAKVAVRAATDPVFPPGIVDVYGIQRFSQQMSR